MRERRNKDITQGNSLNSEILVNLNSYVNEHTYICSIKMSWYTILQKKKLPPGHSVRISKLW